MCVCEREGGGCQHEVFTSVLPSPHPPPQKMTPHLLGLLLVHSLHQNALVLEDVSLDLSRTRRPAANVCGYVSKSSVPRLPLPAACASHLVPQAVLRGCRRHRREGLPV